MFQTSGRTLMNRKSCAAITAVAAMCCHVLTACSAVSSGENKSSSSKADPKFDDVRSELATVSSIPEFIAPGEKIDVSSLRGKKITAIPLAASPQNSAIHDTLDEVAKEVGITVSYCSNQGKPAQWSQCLDQAVATKQDLIILDVDPSVVGPQLAAAKAAGIPVLSSHYFPEDTTVTSPNCKNCSAGISAIQPAPFKAAAKAMVDWTIADGNGKVNAIVPLITGLAPTVAMQKVIEDEFASKCPDCTYKILPTTIDDVMGAGYQTAISSALNADPDVNYVIDQADFLAPATVAALRTAGRNNVKVAGFNGIPSALQLIADGTPFSMDVGEPADWIGYAVMDSAFRLLLGKPAAQKPTPIRVWTKDNISDAGDPPNVTSGYGDAYVDGYMQLWGLSE